MPTTAITDAVVFPQDPGTSPSGTIGFATDPPSGASFALHAAYQSGAGAYVLNGENGSLGFTVDSVNDELTIDPGVCYILQDATGTSVQSQTGTTYDVPLPGTVSIVYAVIVPTSVTVALDTDSENTVYLSVDPDTRNSATAHAGAGLGTPSDPAIELGTVDSAAGTTVARANDRPDGVYDVIDAATVSASGSVTDASGTEHTGELADDGDAQPPEQHDHSGDDLSPNSVDANTVSANDGTFNDTITDPEGNTLTSLKSPSFRVQDEAVTFTESEVETVTDRTKIIEGSVLLNFPDVIEDFEDGDLTISSENWNGWNGDTNNLSAQSNTVISGSFSGELRAFGNQTGPEITASAQTPSTGDFYISLIIGSKSNANDDVSIEFGDGNNNTIGSIDFSDDLDKIRWYNGDRPTIVDGWSPNFQYDLRFSFNLSQEEVEVFINGVSEGTYQTQQPAANTVGRFTIGNSSYSSADTDRNLYFDDIRQGGFDNTGTATVDFTEDDVEAYDAVTYQTTEPSSGADTSSVTCDVIDENGTVVIPDIPENEDTDISEDFTASQNPRLRFDLQRDTTSLEPAVEYAAEAYFR